MCKQMIKAKIHGLQNFSFFDEYLQNNNTQFQMVDGNNWYQEHKSDYIFVPLQVSSDTQLLLNSKITNKAWLRCY